MKYCGSLALIIVVLLSSGCATIQKNQKHLNQMGSLMEMFYQNIEIAAWLAWYDNIAWISSDAVMEQDEIKISQLGAEWFVYESDEKFHAVFGKYDPESDVYTIVFHFRIETRDKIEMLDSPVEISLGLNYARALYLSGEALHERLPEIPVRMNRYIRSLDSGEIEVWYLPAGQSDGCLIYGVEACFTFDEDARRIVSEHILNRGFRGLYPKDFPEGEPLNIGDGSYEIPSVGEIFFATAFASYFDTIYIVSKNYLSTRVVVDGEAAWIHSEWHEDNK